jgi:hypothetical protein
MPWIMRAIWSAPPPGPAGMMNSTGLVGSQAAKAGETLAAPRANAVEINAPFNFIFMNAPPKNLNTNVTLASIYYGLIFTQSEGRSLDSHQQLLNG